MLLSLGILLLHAFGTAQGNVTIYYAPGQNPFATPSGSAAAANYTGAAAYNPTVLTPPPLPSPMPALQFTLALQSGSGVQGLSIPQSGDFVGFSVEMSVSNQVFGKNASFLQVPFLNLMANLQSRAGRVNIRVGGNTQETAVLVDSTPDGKILEKDISGVSNPTLTPPLVFTPELLYMLRNISSHVDVRWFLGIPFNDTSNFRLGIAEAGQAILGDYLIGLQVGNEPDLYARHGHRPTTYGPFDYLGEFQTLVQAMAADSKITNQNMLIGPNIATGDWTPEQVWDTGFIDQLNNSLGYLAVEKYPTDNCFAQFGIGTPQSAQDLFSTFLAHSSGQSIVGPYINSTAIALQKGKKLLMFETNTASCGGFAGLSDSFGAALWGADYSLQMAFVGFSGALMHVGGQSVFYNPFTPPPTNQSTFHQWTVGPIYYSALVVAEALGPSNISQVLDLGANNNDTHTPAYAIYENGVPVRVALFNYMDDPSGASALQVSIQTPGDSSGPPSQVQVKYLGASSVSQKGNITWAGQTLGGNFDSDGRLQGTEQIITVPCTPTPNNPTPATSTCTINVPAPGFALVFLTANSQTEGKGAPTTTFATTAVTRTANTVTVNASVLATSNGHSDMEARLGSTSKGSVNAAVRRGAPGVGSGVVGLLGLVVGGWVMRRGVRG